MPTLSYAPTVAAALKSQLATALLATGLEGGDFPVYDAAPPQLLGFDACIIGDIIQGRNEYVVMRAGRKPRTEIWTQQVWFWCIRHGTEALPARQAAFSSYGKLEDIVANDPSLGTGEPTLVAVVQQYAANTVQDLTQNGFRCNLVADVELTVRLR